MKALGVMGVSLDVHWSLVETAPQQYSWAAYQKLLQHIKDVGLKARVRFLRGLPS